MLEKLKRTGKTDPATNEEAQTLLRFSGWGGLLTELNSEKNQPKLARYLRPSQLYAAKESAMTAFYTGSSLAAGLWDLLKQAGYTGGRVLETSAGTGIFINQRLAEFDDSQHFTAIEPESVSSQILAHTNPRAWVQRTGFETADLSVDGYDLVIGNYPFGELKLSDSEVGQHSIHNYFLLKSLRHVRVGGVIAVITSPWTLDAKDTTLRQKVADQADLLTALRLPSGVFGDTNTDTVSDLLIFRKRKAGTLYSGIPFVRLKESSFTAGRSITLYDNGLATAKHREGEQVPVQLNEAFLSDGGYLVGTPSAVGNRFGDAVELSLKGTREDAVAALSSIGSNTDKRWFDKKNLYLSEGAPRKTFTERFEFRPMVGSLQRSTANELVVITNVREEEGIFYATSTTAKIAVRDVARAEALIDLRDLLKSLITEESSLHGDVEEMDSLRSRLNGGYDSFVKQFGVINDKRNRRILHQDAEGPFLLGLEIYDEESKTAEKSRIFFERTIRPAQQATSASSLKEAAALSFSMLGRIDEQRIASLLDKDFSQALRDEPGVLFKDPADGHWYPREIYLTGNVREKLRLAKSALEDDPTYSVNVEAIDQVVPQDIPCEDIIVDLSSSWIPAKDFEAFVQDQVAARGISGVRCRVTRLYQGEVSVSLKPGRQGSTADYQRIIDSELGTAHRNFPSLVSAGMLNRPIKVTESDNGKTYELKEESLKANAKMAEIQDAFKLWVWQDAERAERLERLYNDQFNAINIEEFSGEGYIFPGLSPAWQPRAHQSALVVRSLMTGNTLAAHCVGAGKTLEMVMLGMEMKRLGMANKPAIAVPNHMLYQLASEAATFYPNAKISMISKSDLTKGNRRAMLGRIAMNDWDLVIITHSVMDRIRVPHYLEQDILVEELSKLEDEMLQTSTLDDEDGRRFSARQIQKAIRNRRQRLQTLQEEALKSTDSIDIAQLGIDAISIDEAHLFKNLELDSRATAPGLSVSASAKAWNLYLKTRYIMDRNNGEERGINFFTGTPISNSMSELYTLQRYMRPKMLEGMGINHFGDWLGAFGEITTELEMLPEGGGFHMKQRLNRFKNVSELLIAFRLFADIKTRDELGLPAPEYEEVNVVAEPSEWQQLYLDDLTRRATEVRNRRVDNRKDNLLKIVGDGRKAALDMRLVHPALPREPDTKIDLLVTNLLDVYRRFDADKAAQIIFCDVSTPTGKKPFDAYSAAKAELTAAGVPEAEIAFIHDYDKDEEKLSLFKRVRSGIVRFLFGSTEKLGTGTNIQERLVAEHNLDAPWRPSDLEQRLGRIVRQGNMYGKVWIYNYTTKDSFDLFMWETNKRKATFIAQIMKDPKTAPRTMTEDTELNYAEVVALTTGNPAIREKVKVDAEVAKLSRSEAMFHANESRRHREAESAAKRIDVLADRLRQIRQDITQVKESTARYPSDVEVVLEIEGQIADIQDGAVTWIERKAAARALAAATNTAGLVSDKDSPSKRLGALFGVGVSVSFHAGERAALSLECATTEEVTARQPHRTLRDLTDQLASHLPQVYRACAKAKEEAEKQVADYDPTRRTFPKQEELQELRKRQQELDFELAALSAEKEAEEPAKQLVEFQQYLDDYLEELGHDDLAEHGSFHQRLEASLTETGTLALSD